MYLVLAHIKKANWKLNHKELKWCLPQITRQKDISNEENIALDYARAYLMIPVNTREHSNHTAHFQESLT